MAQTKRPEVLRRIQIILHGDDYDRLLAECQDNDETISHYGRQLIRKALRDERDSKINRKNDDQRSRKHGLKNTQG
jgi:hypothetical protein